MKQTGLTIYLNNGQPFAALMPKAEADRIVADWASGQLAMKGIVKLSGVTIDGVHWSMSLDSVIGMYSFEREIEEQAGLPAKRSHYLPPGASGLN